VQGRLITPALAVVASAAAFAGIAYGSTVPWKRQDKQLIRACAATRKSIANAMNAAGSAPSQTFESSLDVITPLQLWGRIYFGSGGTLTVGGGESFAGCARRGSGAPALGPEPARVVSTLHETFTTPGVYTLTFTLNRLGQKLMAELRAAQRTYRKRHPHGHHPPEFVVAVAVAYTPAG
jgi:hypothetical protein